MDTPAPQTLPVKYQRALSGQDALSSFTEVELAELLAHLNDAYRRGAPLVDNDQYDFVFRAELKARNPSHPFLTQVEPEADDVFAGERWTHVNPLLSTAKAYDAADVDSFVRQIERAAEALGIDPASVTINVQGKLDGLAGHDYGEAHALVTRGKNGVGNDVSACLRAGVVAVGGRGLGAGELVVVAAYFYEHLKEQFALADPRAFMIGLVGSKTLKAHHVKALEAGVCRFVPYATLPTIAVPLQEFRDRWEQELFAAQDLPYKCDGAVASVSDPRIRAHLGSTSDHHRWQVALKRNESAAETVVERIELATGRTGRISQTLILSPVTISGITATRATAHTASHVMNLRLGPGAKVTVVRAGLVIPALEEVLEGVDSPGVDYTKCPCCDEPTEWDGKFVVCGNSSGCSAQLEASLEHFFLTMNSAKGFGPAIVETLVRAGVKSVGDIYAMNDVALMRAGISGGTARNLHAELKRSLTEPVSDAVFLAAFGLRHVGRGDSRRILSHIPIERLPDLTVEQLMSIPGFADKTSPLIVSAIQKAWPRIRGMLDLGFQLERTRLASERANTPHSAIAGMTVVFTGSMHAPREQLEAQARALGATVGSGVTRSTTLLICGANVGEKKTSKARELGVRVVSETEYLDLVRASAPALDDSAPRPDPTPAPAPPIPARVLPRPQADSVEAQGDLFGSF